MESTISVGCQWSLFKSINLALTWLSHKYQKGNSHLLHSEYLHVYRRTTQQTDQLSQKSTGRLFFKRWVQCTFWAYSCPSSNCIQQIWTLITPFWQQIDTHLQINRILQAKRRHITVTVMGSSLKHFCFAVCSAQQLPAPVLKSHDQFKNWVSWRSQGISDEKLPAVKLSELWNLNA